MTLLNFVLRVSDKDQINDIKNHISSLNREIDNLKLSIISINDEFSANPQLTDTRVGK